MLRIAILGVGGVLHLICIAIGRDRYDRVRVKKD